MDQETYEYLLGDHPSEMREARAALAPQPLPFIVHDTIPAPPMWCAP